jgi:hypothetical protein
MDVSINYSTYVICYEVQYFYLRRSPIFWTNTISTDETQPDNISCMVSRHFNAGSLKVSKWCQWMTDGALHSNGWLRRAARSVWETNLLKQMTCVDNWVLWAYGPEGWWPDGWMRHRKDLDRTTGWMICYVLNLNDVEVSRRFEVQCRVAISRLLFCTHMRLVEAC